MSTPADVIAPESLQVLADTVAWSPPRADQIGNDLSAVGVLAFVVLAVALVWMLAGAWERVGKGK